MVVPFLQLERRFVTALPDSRMEVTAIIDSGNYVVVEGADSGTHAGPLGTPAAYDDDHEQLAAELPVYDALYAWCCKQAAAS